MSASVCTRSMPGCDCSRYAIPAISRYSYRLPSRSAVTAVETVRLNAVCQFDKRSEATTFRLLQTRSKPRLRFAGMSILGGVVMPQREGVGLAIKRYRGFYSLYNRGATACNDPGKLIISLCLCRKAVLSTTSTSSTCRESGPQFVTSAKKDV